MVPKKEFKEDAADRQARFKVPFNQAPGSTKFKSLTLQNLKALRMQQASSQASPGKGTPTQVGPSPRVDAKERSSSFASASALAGMIERLQQ